MVTHPCLCNAGPNEDVPAGDMGCSPREIGWMYGQWKRLTSNAGGVLTGKGSVLILLLQFLCLRLSYSLSAFACLPPVGQGKMLHCDWGVMSTGLDVSWLFCLHTLLHSVHAASPFL